MKRAALLLALLLSLAGQIKAQYVGGNVSFGTAPSCIVSIPNTGIGDTFFLDVFSGSATGITSVSDQLGNAVPVLQQSSWSSNSQYTERLYSGTNHSGGTLTLTVKPSVSAYLECYAYDYKPMVLDAVATPKTGTGASGSSNVVSTTNANDLLFAFFHSDGGVSNTAGTGFTGRKAGVQSYPLAEDQLLASVGSHSATMGFSASANYVGFLTAFKVVQSSGPSAPSITIGTITINIGTSPVQHTVTLTWNPSSGGIGYNVYRSNTSSGGSYVKLTASPTTLQTFTDSTVAPGTTYAYAVTTVAVPCPASPLCGESTYSNQATAVIPSP